MRQFGYLYCVGRAWRNNTWMTVLNLGRCAPRFLQRQERREEEGFMCTHARALVGTQGLSHAPFIHVHSHTLLRIHALFYASLSLSFLLEHVNRNRRHLLLMVGPAFPVFCLGEDGGAQERRGVPSIRPQCCWSARAKLESRSPRQAPPLPNVWEIIRKVRSWLWC